MSFFCCSLKSQILKSVVDISSTLLHVDMDPLSISINGFIPSVIDISNIQINLDLSNNELVRTVCYIQDISNNIASATKNDINNINTDISNNQLLVNEVAKNVNEVSKVLQEKII
jgi:hypothetical protein